MKNKERAISEVIKIVWASFKTHLAYIELENPPKIYELGDKKWHKKRCQDYIKVIKVLTDLL